MAGIAVALARGGANPLQAKLPGLEGVAGRQANDDDAVFVSDVGVVGVDRGIEDERTPVGAGVPFVLQDFLVSLESPSRRSVEDQPAFRVEGDVNILRFQAGHGRRHYEAVIAPVYLHRHALLSLLTA